MVAWLVNSTDIEVLNNAAKKLSLSSPDCLNKLLKGPEEALAISGVNISPFCLTIDLLHDSIGGCRF